MSKIKSILLILATVLSQWLAKESFAEELNKSPQNEMQRFVPARVDFLMGYKNIDGVEKIHTFLIESLNVAKSFYRNTIYDSYGNEYYGDNRIARLIDAQVVLDGIKHLDLMNGGLISLESDTDVLHVSIALKNSSLFEDVDLQRVLASKKILISKQGIRIDNYFAPCEFVDDKWYYCKAKIGARRSRLDATLPTKFPFKLTQNDNAWMFANVNMIHRYIYLNDSEKIILSGLPKTLSVMAKFNRSVVDVYLDGVFAHASKNKTVQNELSIPNSSVSLNIDFNKTVDTMAYNIKSTLGLLRNERDVMAIDLILKRFDHIKKCIVGNMDFSFNGSIFRPLVSIGVKDASCAIDVINELMSYEKGIKWAAPTSDDIKYIDVLSLIRVPILLGDQRVILARYPQDIDIAKTPEWLTPNEKNEEIINFRLFNSLSPNVISTFFMPSQKSYLTGTVFEPFGSLSALHEFILRINSINIKLIQRSKYIQMSIKLDRVPYGKNVTNEHALKFNEIVKHALDFDVQKTNALLIELAASPENNTYTQRARQILLGGI